MRDNSDYFWYKAPEDKVFESIFGHVAEIEKEQRDVQEKHLLHARLYSNRYEPGLGAGARGAVRSGYAAITENVIASVVDTATALIGKSRPKVTVLTDDGDWSTQQIARHLDRYLWGMFRRLRVFDKATAMFRNSCVFGTGFLYPFVDGDELKLEHVLVSEVTVDESAVPCGSSPRDWFRLRPVAKQVLIDRFPDKEAEILNSSVAGAQQDHYLSHRYKGLPDDMTLLMEAWHTGSDGRYVASVSTGDLIDEDWKHDFGPFIQFNWNDPLTGFYGQGIAELLVGFQVRLNELNDFIRKCQDRIAVPRVFMPAGGKVNKPYIDNTIGAMIPFFGNQMPRFDTPTALTNEIYGFRETIIRSAFEFAGVSKMAAQATRPEGIEAAVALRELSDNQSQRFSIQQQRFESMFLELGERIALLSKELYKGKRPKEGEYPETDLTCLIDWEKVDFDDRSFQMQAQASSMLSETPAGRLQKVIELSQYGVPIRPDEIRRLLALPDLELSDRRATSALDDVEWVIDRLQEGYYDAPEPFQDLSLGVQRVTAAYLDARRKGAPREVQENFRTWIIQASKLLAPPPAPAGAPLPAPGVDGQLAAPQGAGLADIGSDAFTETALPGLAVGGPINR